MTTELSDFQRDALADVRNVLQEAGRSSESESMLGNEEKYMAIAFGGYKVLLYVDGAELLGNGLDRRFEKYDFDSLDDLRTHFIREVRQLMT
jgi:hypothetical protein